MPDRLLGAVLTKAKNRADEEALEGVEGRRSWFVNSKRSRATNETTGGSWYRVDGLRREPILWV